MDIITDLEQIQYALILIHGGENHYPSKLALDIWRNSELRGLSDVEVVDGRVKQWLISNYENIAIKEIPCILFCRNGSSTIVYPISYMERVMRTINS
jgi:hypothetical protein